MNTSLPCQNLMHIQDGGQVKANNMCNVWNLHLNVFSNFKLKSDVLKACGNNRAIGKSQGTEGKQKATAPFCSQLLNTGV